MIYPVVVSENLCLIESIGYAVKKH